MGAFYAVKKGRKVGLFNSIIEYDNATKGFKGFIAKKFSDEKQAKKWLDGKLELKSKKVKIFVTADNTKTTILAPKKKANRNTTIHAHVDGSHISNTPFSSYAVIFTTEEGIYIESIAGTTNNFSELKNVAGELYGASQAINWAITNGYKKIIIHYDCNQIEKLVNGASSAKSSGTRAYINYMNYVQEKIEIEYSYNKAHCGHFYNSEVDKLARAIAESRSKTVKSVPKVENLNYYSNNVNCN